MKRFTCLQSINLISFAFLFTLLSCDFYKDDSSAAITSKVEFLADKSILVSLQSKLDMANVDKFEIVERTPAGRVEIIKDKFMIYTPGNLESESATLKLLDKNNKELGTRRLLFERSTNNCGIAEFDYAEIPSDSILHINLASNDNFCTNINSGIVTVIPLGDNESEDFNAGLVISIGIGRRSSLDITYTPPKGFTGTARYIYIAGLNHKPEYNNDQTDKLMASPDFNLAEHSYMFEYFTASIVEIKVK